MTFRYRNFKVYQDSIGAYRFIITITKIFPKDFDHLREQARRASLSVVLNIAEGSAKNSDKDFNRYLGNSLGSVNEVEACLEVACYLKLISEDEFNQGSSLYRLIANQLGGFSKKLKS